ncbi:hypothetical protein Tco_0740321 [Tanacetum coccineum]
MMVRVLQSAINATNLATSLVTIGVREMPTTLTTRRAPDRVRNLLVLSVELQPPAKVYGGGNAGANPDNVLRDWLAKYQAVIVCAEKTVSIPWRNKTLIIHGDGSTQGNVTRLNVISCTKTQEYMEKGFPIFLSHVTIKEVEDKSKKKRLEDVPIVQDFPEVFPEDLPGLPPTRQVEFQIGLGTLVQYTAPVPSGALSIGTFRKWRKSYRSN